MALVIAGERSGVGKTTVTLALLAFLSQRGVRVQSFKVGPDFIDPMFHQYVTGLPCRNLDPVLTSEAYVQQCFALHTQGVESALVEGVMGLFDGVGQLEKSPLCPYTFASTAHIAQLLNLPVVLVIDCSRLSGSVAAIAHGYRTLDPRVNIAGVVLNRVGSDRHLSLLKNALEHLQLPILGVLKRQENITIPDRHLGLVPTAELPQLNAIIKQLAHIGETCFNWELLSPLLNSTFHNPPSPPPTLPLASSSLKIAVARDRAFNFYYQDNLDLLQQLGAQLVFWSPLEDAGLPDDVQGMYFGGGFPEIFAQQLAENTKALHAVKTAILRGMPTIAECGGLMYLCEQIVDFHSQSWSMVGVLPTVAVMGGRLTLGYRRAVALQNNLLVDANSTVYGHEFHRSTLTCTVNQPLFKTYRYDSEETTGFEGWGINDLPSVYASYIHLHWGERIDIPQRFLQHIGIFVGELKSYI